MTNAPELIDSHCHLNYDYAPKDVDQLLAEGAKEGVSNFVTVGVDIKTLPEIQAVSARYPNVYHSAGLHPHDAVDWLPEYADVLRQAAKNPKCRAIGEIGLDYHYNHSTPETQKRVVEEQLELAVELGLPVIIHSREGEADLLERLTAYAKRARARSAPGVIHCFTGTKEFGLACLDLGFLISFSGILTFKKAEDLHECARAFPLDRMMVETDSPYLAPIPFRGKKCEPAMVKMTALKLAELKGVSFDEVAAKTTANAKAFFGIG